jgi:hypothetical protein
MILLQYSDTISIWRVCPNCEAPFYCAVVASIFLKKNLIVHPEIMLIEN